MQEIIQTRALVLGSIPHKELNQILSLFSPTLGRISVYMRNTKKSVIEQGALCSALTVGEFTIRQTRTDLYRFEEGKALNLHFPLRKEYPLLETALLCLKSLKEGVWRGAPSPELFHLTLKILERIPYFTQPQTALALFRIKLLKHEGLLSGNAYCSHCKKTAPLYFQEGELYCEKHISYQAQRWEEKELNELFTLYHAKNFQEIETMEGIDESKIEDLYKDLYLR